MVTPGARREAVAHARALQERMRGLVEAIDAGFMGDIKHILHILCDSKFLSFFFL